MFASFFGTFFSIFIAGFLLILVFIAMLTGVATSTLSSASSEKAIKIEDNSILHITLNTPIQDRTSDNPFENFDFNTFENSNNLGLDRILTTIKKAKSDDKIKGIYLDLTSINTGMASIEEIRIALNDFKKSKKWIISYSEIYTQRTYYLASVADKIYLNPAGIMELRGLGNQLMFFKNMLEKLDVDVQIIRHGKFKSAVEPYMLEKMSDANREQMQKILNTMWGSMLNDVSGSRNIKVDKIINVKARYFKFNQFKSTQVIADVIYTDLKSNQTLDAFLIDSEFIFENNYARFRGDKRALKRKDKDLLDHRHVHFPTDAQMVYDTGEDLKLQLKDIISSYRIRV